ncbi:hypothetical protein [Methylomonas rapida]|uniref:Lipoprotein n=1 Tax=Methylomonas rapida TaxID=2963939 RepID=A0ABY7GJM8_9GAMM|nr:hypothetical protein [Methylomonas rapida]WAR44801.1 hypothetical protein NM686_021080 [Methylomonas rapida]
MRTLIHALMLAPVLTACSSATEDQKNNQKAVVDAVQQPLDKAKDVERQLLDNAEARRKQMDDM